MILDPIFSFFSYLLHAFTRNFLNNSAILQMLGSLASFLLAFLSSRSVLFRLESVKNFSKIKNFFHHNTTALVIVSIWIFFQTWIVLVGMQTEMGTHLSQPVLSFLATWVLIKIVSQSIKNSSYSKMVSLALWIGSTLLILGLFDPIYHLLHQLSFSIGTFHLSLWMLLKASITLLAVIWIALSLSRWAEKQIHLNRHIEPSSKVLLSKFIKMSFVAFGVLLALSNIGFDLSIFTLFGGAIGVGIGFGLQKVVSNLICGIVLLLDKTVKPGDVIALGPNNFGIVNRLGARCVSVRTLAGEEHLIPNEEMITSKIENWSYTDPNIRVEVNIRVSFHEDIDLALRLMRQAAFNVRRILIEPRPMALIQNISEYAVELSLKVWIEDPHLGLGEVKSEIYFNILRLFKQHQIQIPYPYQNVFLSESKGLFSFEKSPLNTN